MKDSMLVEGGQLFSEKSRYFSAGNPTRIPEGQFPANRAYFHPLPFACNLVNWFKRLCLPTEYHAMILGTLRPRLFMSPAEFVRLSQGQTSRFPPVLPDQAIIKHALEHIHRL
jgi:hypothetical protein